MRPLPSGAILRLAYCQLLVFDASCTVCNCTMSVHSSVCPVDGWQQRLAAGLLQLGLWQQILSIAASAVYWLLIDICHRRQNAAAAIQRYAVIRGTRVAQTCLYCCRRTIVVCTVFLFKPCRVFAAVEHSTWLRACRAWFLAQLHSMPCT